MSPFLRSFLITLAGLMLAFIAFSAGYVTRDRLGPHSSNFQILNEAYDVLLNHGLKDPPEDPALQYGMIHGMVQAYGDPYTLFIEPPQHELETNELQGSFGGIGVSISTDPQGYYLLYPFPESPAREAGIVDGDRLLAVEDLVVSPGTPVDQITSAIRGPVGQPVTLTVASPPGYAPRQVQVKRAEIPLPSTTWHLDPAEPQVGIIQINRIAASTVEEIQTAVAGLQTRGAKYFVLDLRNNPGGLLEAGVDVARLFLAEGEVIDEQYRGQDVRTERVKEPGPLAEIPLAVVIDHGSASAAEIIAGALQAHHRAILVGAPSYGKDSIQLVFDLSDGSSLHVTAAKWWVPGLEKPVGEGGLQPDVLVEPSTGTNGPDAFLQAAVQAILADSRAQ